MPNKNLLHPTGTRSARESALLKIMGEGVSCRVSPENQSYPGLHKKQHGKQVEGRDSPPLLCFREASPGVLCPAAGSPAQDTDLLE